MVVFWEQISTRVNNLSLRLTPSEGKLPGNEVDKYRTRIAVAEK